MNAAQYMKNVGKSMGYIAIDSFKKMSPGLAAVYDNAKDFTSELFDTIDDFKYNIASIDNDKSVASKAKNTATEAWKNARDDFLSGNWYNRERKEAADEEFAKSMGLDLDFDVDDFLGDDNPTNDQSAQETQAVIGTIDGSVSAAANSMTSATVQSADYLASVANANTGVLYNLNSKGFNNINLGLNAINANITTMMSLAEPLTTHMRNSATFYAKSTELQEKTVSLLEQLVKNTSPVKKEDSYSSRSLYDYINEGGVNIGALFSDAKEDILKNVESWKEMFSMFGGGGGDFKASPISSALSMLFPMLLPRDTRKRLKGFNDFLEVAGFNEMNKLSRKYNNSLLGFVGDLLGFSMPSLETKLEMSSKNYQKGKVDWNGKAQKALMEVIPYYLSKMTAIMSGTGEMEIFNYETGKFTTKKALQAEYDRQKKNTIDYAGWDLYDAITETTPNVSITQDEINELSGILIKSGRTDYAKLFSVKKDERENFIDSVDGLRDFFKTHKNLYNYIVKAATNTGQNKWGRKNSKNAQDIITKYELANYANEIGAAHGDLKDLLEKLEESGEYNVLINGSTDIENIGAGMTSGGKGGGGIFGIDKNGYSALDYLRGIYINTVGGFGGTAGSDGSIPGIRDYLVEPVVEPEKKKRSRKVKNDQGAVSETESEKPKTDMDILNDYIESNYTTSKMSDSQIKELKKSLKEDPTIKKYLLKKAKHDALDDGSKFIEDDSIEARIRIKVFGNKINNFAQDHKIADQFGGFFEKIGNIIRYPVDIVNRTLDAIKSTIHDIVFSEKGIWGWLFDKDDGKLRPVLDRIANTIFGKPIGGGEGSSEDFNPAENINDNVGVVTNESIINDVINAANDITNAANGRMVKKTGLVAVSEGELIVPAEFNPFYKKHVDKAKQIAGETAAIKNFYGAFNKGGTVGQKQEKVEREGGLLGAGKNLLEKGFADFGHLLYDAVKGSLGLGDKEKQEHDKKVTEDVIKNAVKGIEEHAGDAIVGGLIGGGVSLLTGSVVSPLLGAAIGAGTGLLISSNRVKTFLFGDDTDPEKGLIGGETGKKIRAFIEDQLPTSLVGGALGGVGGALLGHPLLGLFLGSGIGFATKSATAQDFLFGTKDKNGERTGISADGSRAIFSKELQDRLKKAMPGMSVGAIGGIVATAMGGPFGLIPNLLLGSATGAFVTSETFKNWFLGEKGEDGKREGGFIKILRERLFDPVREIFFNVGERLRQDFREVAIGLSGVLKDVTVKFFEKGLGKYIKQGISGAINGLGKLLGIENLTAKLPQWMTLQGLSNRFKRRNLMRGNLVLDKNGKALTASERLEQMEDLGARTDSYGFRMTQMLAGENGEGLDKNQLKDLNKASKALLKAKTPEERQEIISGNDYLSKLYSDNNNKLSDSEIRKLQDSLKVEMGKNPMQIALEATGNDVKDILENVKKMVTSGIKIDTGNEEKLPPIEERTISWEEAQRRERENQESITQYRAQTGANQYVNVFSGGNQTTGESEASTAAGQQARIEQAQWEAAQRINNESIRRTPEAIEDLKDTLAGTDTTDRNDRETKKHGFFGKFFGEESFIGKAAKLITKVGDFILKVAPIALVAFATGVFDDLFAELGIGYGKAANITVTDAQGNSKEVERITEIIKQLPTGTTTDENGNTVTTTQDYQHYDVSVNDTASLSDRAMSTIAHGFSNGLVKIGAKNIAKITNSRFGQKVGEKILAKAGKISTEVGDDLISAAVVLFRDGLDDVIIRLMDLPMIKGKGLETALAKFSDDFGEAVAKVIGKGGTKTASEILQSIATPLQIAFAVIDFSTGMQDAEVIMKVANPSIPERLFCGVLKALKNNIPYVGIVGGLIPESLVFDLLYNTVGKALGLKDIEKQRAEAEAELAEFNKNRAPEDQLNWAQYMKQEKGHATFTEKAGATIKEGFINTVAAFKDPKQYLNNIMTGVSEGWQSGDNLLSKIMGASAGYMGEAMPGIIGDVYESATRVWKAAFEGDISGVFLTNIENFEDSDDPINGFLSHLLNPTLLVNKIVAAPIALMSKLILNIRDGFTEFDFGNGVIGSLFEDSLNIAGHALAGDIKEMWTYSPNLNTKSKFVEGVWDVISTMDKVIYTPFAAITWVVKKVWNGISELTGGLKDFAVTMVTKAPVQELADSVSSGDLKGLWNIQPPETDFEFGNTLAKISYGMSKVMYTIPTTMTWIGHQVWDKGIKPTIDGIQAGFGYLKEQTEIGMGYVTSDDRTDLDNLFDIPEPGNDVRMPGLFKAAAIGARVLGIGIQTVKGVFEVFKDMYVKEIAPEFKAIGTDIKTNVKEVWSTVTKGDAGKFSYFEPKFTTKTGFAKAITTGTINTVSFIAKPLSIVTTAIRLFSDGVKEEIGHGKTVFGDLKNDVSSMWEMAKSARLVDVAMMESTASINADSSHPIWGGISNLGFYLGKGVSIGVAGILDLFGLIGNKVVTAVNNIKTVISTAKEQVQVGSDMLSENPSMSFDEFLNDITVGINFETEDPFEKVLNVVSVGSRFIGAPITILKWTGQSIAEDISNLVGTVKGGITTTMENIDLGIEIGKEGLTDENKEKMFNALDRMPEDKGIDGIFNFISTLPMIGGMGIGLWVRGANVIGNFIQDKVSKLRSDADTYEVASLDMMNMLDDPEKNFNDIFDLQPEFKSPIDGLFNAGFFIGKVFYGTIKLFKGFFKELKLSDMFGNVWDTIREIGSYKADDSASGSGVGGGASGFVSQKDARYADKSLGGYNVGDMGCGPAVASMMMGNSMSSNINLARKYQTAGGTDLAYFADAFARNGRSAKYYNLSAGASGTDMVRDIASGKPVVLMGRNPYNTSKRNSPFGPNNHYVVARGFKNGGVVIDDPELGAGGRVYNTNILNSVTAAVGAGYSGLRRLTGIGAGGATVNGITDNIWAFFRDKGYTEAATAGILANMQSESSFNTGVTGDQGLVEGGSHGLCQWNRGRWQACIDLAKSMGRDPSDLTVQLEHCHNEINQGKAGGGYANITDPYKAGYDFCVKFEVPQDKEKKGDARGNLAIDFYNHYTGSNIPYHDNPIFTNGSSATGKGTSGGKELTPFQKLLSIPSIIGNAFAKAFTGGSDNEATTSTYSNGNNSEQSILNNSISVAQWPGKQPVEYMRDVLGKLQYSKSNRDPDKGGGDCSSTVAWALTKAGLPVTNDSRWQYMNNTDPYTHPDWQNVVWYDGGHRFEERNPGKNVEDLVNLQPNDVIFYSWKDSKSTYPDHVDHVEMYNGGHELIGNGGGVGTRTRSVHDMQKDIIKIARPKDIWNEGASGSGLPLNNSFIKASKEAKVYDINKYRQSKAAGDSGIDKSTALLLKSIITLIETLVKNTNDISAIYEIISVYCSKNPSDVSAKALSEIAKNRSDDMSSIEEGLAGLKATVDSILAS